MKILITGTTGYIGRRLIPVLLEMGHNLVCCVRDEARVPEIVKDNKQIELIEVDFLDANSLKKIPSDIDAAYYLIHSMSASSTKFETLEQRCAINFKEHLGKTTIKHVIYLSGIVNDTELSKHLISRRNVEKILGEGNFSDIRGNKR